MNGGGGVGVWGVSGGGNLRNGWNATIQYQGTRLDISFVICRVNVSLCWLSGIAALTVDLRARNNESAIKRRVWWLFRRLPHLHLDAPGRTREVIHVACRSLSRSNRR